MDYGNNGVIATLRTEDRTEIANREQSRLVQIGVLKNITFLVNGLHVSRVCHCSIINVDVYRVPSISLVYIIMYYYC